MHSRLSVFLLMRFFGDILEGLLGLGITYIYIYIPYSGLGAMVGFGMAVRGRKELMGI